METLLIYNPLKEDFVYDWFDDKDQKETLVLPSLEITRLPDSQALFMGKHLADRIYQSRELGRMDRDVAYQKIYKEIYVTDELD